MAEAVGLAASIVGLTACAFKIAKLCYGCYGKVKGVPEDIKQLADEISSLADLLRPFSTPAGASKISDPDLVSRSVGEIMGILEELLEELQDELQGLTKHSDSSTRNLIRRLKTSLKQAFKKEDTQNRIRKIEKLKAGLSLTLQLWVAHILRPETRRAESVAETRGCEKMWIRSLNGSPTSVPVNAMKISVQRECRALATGS